MVVDVDTTYGSLKQNVLISTKYKKYGYKLIHNEGWKRMLLESDFLRSSAKGEIKWSS